MINMKIEISNQQCVSGNELIDSVNKLIYDGVQLCITASTNDSEICSIYFDVNRAMLNELHLLILVMESKLNFKEMDSGIIYKDEQS